MKFKYGLAFPEADNYLFDRIPENGVWQDDAFQAGIKACKNFSRAIDGGAHIGTWSLEFMRHFEKVIAFEPAKDTFEALKYNTKNTGIEIRNQALGKKSGYIKMTWTEKDQNRNHTGARYITKGGDIERTTIDFVCRNLDFVDLIKLDLEGGEPDALLGAKKTLLRCKPVIVFEDKGFCERFGYDRTASIHILDNLGAHEIKKCGINRIWGWE